MPITLPKFGSALVALALCSLAHAQEKSGEVLYRQFCAKCHGAKGEGAKQYPQPLIGDKSLAQLAHVIDLTMPEGDPDRLDAAESKRVAEFMYGAFYSPDAQAKLNPPRVELSRLTVKQYRNSVADVIGSFRPAPKLDEKQGLRGEYFNARGFQQNKRQIDRLDPEVKFDFGKEAPKSDSELKEKFDPHTFSIRWEGSVVAPETGLYEFVVRTDHALRLWVNDPRKAGHRRLGEVRHRHRVHGPRLPARGPGVPDPAGVLEGQAGRGRLEEEPEPAGQARVRVAQLEAPGRAVEPIPARHLTPAKFPEVAVIEAPFPPDDRSFGWERGTTVSKEWEAATTEGALETAAYVVARLPELSRRAAGRDGSRREAQGVQPDVRRARLPPPAHRRRKVTVHRQAVRSRGRPGTRGQARRAARAEVAAVPVPRRGRRTGAIRSGVATGVRTVGRTARQGTARRRRARANSARATRSRSRPSGCSPTRGRRRRCATSC